MSMSKLLENGLEAQVINGLTRDNTKVATVLFTSPVTNFPPNHKSTVLFTTPAFSNDLGPYHHLTWARSRQNKFVGNESFDKPIYRRLWRTKNVGFSRSGVQQKVGGHFRPWISTTERSTHVHDIVLSPSYRAFASCKMATKTKCSKFGYRIFDHVVRRSPVC